MSKPVILVIGTTRKITGHAIPAMVAERRAGDPAVPVAASSRIRSGPGWKPEYEGLAAITPTARSRHQQAAAAS